MANEYIIKHDLLINLENQKSKWMEIKGKDRKGKGQDCTHENFIDNVLLVYEWILSDIEKM